MDYSNVFQTCEKFDYQPWMVRVTVGNDAFVGILQGEDTPESAQVRTTLDSIMKELRSVH
jgi:hypothetical protein